MHPPAEQASDPDPHRPLVSVVIPTRNRAPLLHRLLDAVSHLDYPHYDVWVVDDASRDDTSDVLTRWEGEGRHVVRQPVPLGGYAARNLGWRSSDGSLVAFTDDDCVPDRAWLSSLVAALQAPGVVGAQGVTRAEPGTITPFTHQIEQHAPGTPYRTCNIAYKRSILDALGGFDERFHSYADTLFGLQARQRGVIAFASDAVVFHPPRPKEWRTRQWWQTRLRDDLAFRRESRRHGMRPEEIGDVEPFMASRTLWSDIVWVTRPLRTKLCIHAGYLVHHPGEYVHQMPGMARDRWAMLQALLLLWLDRSRSEGNCEARGEVSDGAPDCDSRSRGLSAR